jgi:hypothetical protein
MKASPRWLPPFLSGNNLTASKARLLLLMACLMKFGGLPIARDAGLIQDHRLASDISALVGKERGRQIVTVAAFAGSREAVRRGG